MQESSYITQQNVNNVRAQILQKQQSCPYYATVGDASSVITDYDTFPYPRWFRGVYSSDLPIVAEREAGWRPRHDDCYRVNKPYSNMPYPDHCFESACSTVFPCYPEYLTKYSDKKLLDIMLNKSCIVQYR